MQCFFVIRSYTFWLSSYTFPRTIWSNVSNSDTFLYVLCDSHANFAKSTISYKFRSGFNGYGPCWALQRTTDRGLDILCQISLSIKFPCVLLQVLMRSRLPCQFLDLWDSVLPLVKWPLQCRHELMKWIQGGVHRSVLHSDGWPQPNDTFWYVLHNPSVYSEQWHFFTCVFWKLRLSSYAFRLAFWRMASANWYVLIRSVQPFCVFWSLPRFSLHVFRSTIKFLHVLPCISFKHPL